MVSDQGSRRRKLPKKVGGEPVDQNKYEVKYFNIKKIHGIEPHDR